MDVRFVNPFLSAFTGVVPQVGFKDVTRGKIFSNDQFIDSLGISIQVNMTNTVGGNIVFNMTENTAKTISSTMMMGAVVNTMDDMAKSAVCELVNMIVSHASTSLNQIGFALKVSPPALLQGPMRLTVCNTTYLGIEMIIDKCPIEIAIGLNAG